MELSQALMCGINLVSPRDNAEDCVTEPEGMTMSNGLQFTEQQSAAVFPSSWGKGKGDRALETSDGQAQLP